jgi:hypothetical protein
MKFEIKTPVRGGRYHRRYLEEGCSGLRIIHTQARRLEIWYLRSNGKLGDGVYKGQSRRLGRSQGRVGHRVS